MEVASPLTAFNPSAPGSKRSRACSPPHIDAGTNHGILSAAGSEHLLMQPSAKRRRFHAETSVDALSESFSSHSPFFSAGRQATTSILSSAAVHSLKAHLACTEKPPSVMQEDLSRIVEEQGLVIESLKKDKQGLESSLTSLKADHVRVVKENQILRKAVNIQQERQKHADNELRAAQQYRIDAEDKMKKLEQIVLSLRYHLQAQQLNVGNDFMNLPPRPPDVY